MKNLKFLPALLFSLFLMSCEKEKENETNISFDKIDGYVQKGPYLNGATITISELSPELIPTGKNYTSQILDNKGTFEVRNVKLMSKFVELKADGFYFNEVNNSNSSAQLTLFALSDLTQKSSLNVNLLSYLEKNRVNYLISNGTGFSNAKKQAQSEILSIFKINKPDVAESELLDISKQGEDNAILLAVSVILQGYLSVSDLSELLANISTDLREDGVLNSQILGSILINNAKTIKLDKIRENLENRYQTLGLDATIPDFEKYVNQFIDSTDFEFTGFIEYPESGKHGLNILDKDKTDYAAGNYSMIAVLPEGTGLKVKISGLNWFFPVFQDNTGWEFSEWNNADNSRIFTSTRTGEIDFEVRFETYQDSSWSNNITISVFENEDNEPTWIKEVEVYQETNLGINYPVEGKYGENLLAMQNDQAIEKDVDYSIAAIFPLDIELLIRLKMIVFEGNITWLVDESKQRNWSGIPVSGDEITAQAVGDTADMPIRFSGTGKMELQVETFEAGEFGQYLGTQITELTIN